MSVSESAPVVAPVSVPEVVSGSGVGSGVTGISVVLVEGCVSTSVVEVVTELLVEVVTELLVEVDGV